MRFALFFITGFISQTVYSQVVDVIIYGKEDVHARGIECVNNNLYLACNDGYLRRYDLKTNEKFLLNPIEESPELRDVAHNKKQVITIQSGKEGLMIFTDQYGNRTNVNHVRTAANQQLKEVFWDGIAIENKLGFLMGDPINGEFMLYFSSNSGKDWKPCKGTLKAFDGEAGFAASGTTVHIKKGIFYFVSGGSKSRLHISSNKGENWESFEIPFEAKESAGPFSFAIKDKMNIVTVGGDYTKPKAIEKNCFITSNGGKTWKACATPPNGYRSCIILTDDVYYTCGTTGMDYSTDGGLNWQKLNDFNTFSLAFDENYIYASSLKGKVLKIKKIR